MAIQDKTFFDENIDKVNKKVNIILFCTIPVPVVFAILRTALIAAVQNTVATICITVASDIISEQILGNETERTINDYLYDYYDTAISSFKVGFITGAAAGTFKYAKFYRASGDSISSKVSASQRFQVRMDVVNDKYSNMVITDLPELATEKAKIVMILENTDFSSKGIANNVLRMSWGDVFTKKVRNAGIKHTFTRIKEVVQDG